MTFLGLKPSDAIAATDATSGEPLSYRDLMVRAALISGHLGDDKQLLFLASRNDMYSCTVYAASQLSGHTVALLDGSKPVPSHAHVIADYRPGWVAGPLGTADALTDCGLAVKRVTAALGGELASTW